MAWIKIEPSSLLCDDCHKEPATWMRPEGEATYFSCEPCLDKRTVIVWRKPRRHIPMGKELDVNIPVKFMLQHVPVFTMDGRERNPSLASCSCGWSQWGKGMDMLWPAFVGHLLKEWNKR